MKSFRSLTQELARARASVSVIVLGSSLSLAASEPRNTPPPDPAAPEVSQALDRLTTANDKRVAESIEDSVAALAAKADNTVVAVSRPANGNAAPRFARELHRLHRVRG